jgi:hypothetical protein
MKGEARSEKQEISDFGGRISERVRIGNIETLRSQEISGLSIP